MDLLPSELRVKIPRFGSNTETPIDDRLIYTRYFDPTSNWRWYVLEFDGNDTFFGLVVTTNHALAGQFTLTELQGLRYQHRSLGEVGVERDTYFEPLTFRELKQREPIVGRVFAPSGMSLVGLEGAKPNKG